MVDEAAAQLGSLVASPSLCRPRHRRRRSRCSQEHLCRDLQHGARPVREHEWAARALQSKQVIPAIRTASTVRHQHWQRIIRIVFAPHSDVGGTLLLDARCCAHPCHMSTSRMSSSPHMQVGRGKRTSQEPGLSLRRTAPRPLRAARFAQPRQRRRRSARLPHQARRCSEVPKACNPLAALM